MSLKIVEPEQCEIPIFAATIQVPACDCDELTVQIVVKAPKVAERLDAWLGEGNSLPEKGRWQDLAAEIGVTREALYRELSRRRAQTGSA